VDVKILIQPHAMDSSLLRMTAGSSSEDLIIPSADVLAKIGSALRKSVQAAKRWGVVGREQTPEDAGFLLNLLREKGSSALLDMLGRRAARKNGNLSRFRRFLQDASSRGLEASIPSLSVSASGSILDIPLDLMPVFEYAGDFVTRKRDDLANAAQDCFLGLRFSVRRTLEQPERTILLDPDLHRIVVAPYLHADFRAFDQQMRRFGVPPFPFHVREALPDANMMKARDYVVRMAKLLVAGGKPKEQIVHVIAHGSVTNGGDYESGLLFGRKGFTYDDQARIPLSALDAIIAVGQQPELPEGPLGFLSACEAANVSYMSPSTIPETLLDAGYRAVIAPLVPLNVKSASEVAQSFFEWLSTESKRSDGANEFLTVGQSLVMARRSLLRTLGNPVALLYFCYGETLLRLERP
jgi:CHAT domain-containing protein